MAEADAERRHAALDQRLRVGDRVVEHRRIAGAVAQKHAVGIRWRAARSRASSPDRRARRSRAPRTGAGCSTSCRSRRPRRGSGRDGARGRAPAMKSLSSRPRPGSGQSNGAAHVTSRTRSAPSICGIARAWSTRSSGFGVAGADDAAHHARRPQQPRQRARVDVGDGDDVAAPRGSRASVPSARQLLAIGDSLRMTKPATCRPRDSTSSGVTP